MRGGSLPPEPLKVRDKPSAKPRVEPIPLSGIPYFCNEKSESISGTAQKYNHVFQRQSDACEKAMR